MILAAPILEIESELRRLPTTAAQAENDALFHPVRKALAGALLTLLGPSPPKGQSLGDLIEAAGRYRPAARTAAILVIRALARPGVIPPNDPTNQLDRKIVDLAKFGTPDLCKAYGVKESAQNYQNADILRTVHQDICTKLRFLCSLPRTLESFGSTRQSTLKTMNSTLINTYLQPFEHQRIFSGITAVYNELAQLIDTKDHTYLSKLQAFRRFLEEQTAYARENRTFLTDEFFVLFLETASAAAEDAEKTSVTKFRSDIRSPLGTLEFALEKKYPLRDPGRVSKVAIPLVNVGPGIATSVNASLSTAGDVLLGASEAALGDIPPGQFALAVEVLPSKPISELTLDLDVSWTLVSSTERMSNRFKIKVTSQSSDVDWADLERREPYSTSPAEGSEFVGRREKVRALTTRLLKERMQSSYITGQKRVGKSSLALAVRDVLEREKNISCLYFEYGEIANVDPNAIMKNFGLRLADFLVGYMPGEYSLDKSEFAGSLAPLSRILDAVLRATPDRRFVVIVDEFDEIPPELYRSGAIAETFFSNLRTLAAKRNLAFMLVGGENMPFIVEAQGDQLNKFVREGLSYFSRFDDWTDFCELVTAPVSPAIHWNDGAINEVFTLTSGHPYYAKLLCARIFATALTERDTEITAEEVRRAFRTLVSTLDTNAFAHLWKDGISGSREDAEAVALQRCRLLVALGRIIRAGKPITERAIVDEKHTPLLPEHQIVPILRDFCRRGILIEEGGAYAFTLQLFRDWLAQSGLNNLVGNTLGDELSIGLQRSEDAAYVHDGELATLCADWPLYRSRVVGPNEVRQWLSQASGFRRQRLLFKLLKNLRFFSELELREKLRIAHSIVASFLPDFVRRSISERRNDLLVTYVDGPAKSGHYYASRYVEENGLASTCVKELGSFQTELLKHEESSGVVVNGLVIVDDIVGTGESLAGNITSFVQGHRDILQERNLSVVVVAMCATPEGDRRLREVLGTLQGVRIDLRICEPLSPRHFAFREGSMIWASVDEEAEAKALCLELGQRINRNSPLGYQDQGLLVVFPDTCPNNSLPILHGATSRNGGWTPLFRRLLN